VVVRALERQVLLGQLPQAQRKTFILQVFDRRAQPFQQHRVRRAQQLQRLAQVPAVDIELAADRLLDDVAAGLDGEVPLELVHIDEAHVVVAFRRRKAPAAAAGLAGEEHRDVVLCFDAAQAVEDRRAHGIADGVFAEDARRVHGSHSGGNRDAR
jgi:hypothetical protein